MDENLIGQNCVEVLPITELDDDIKKKALNYLMFLKRKRCRKIKAQGCADGRPQREYISKDESSSPTVSNYALMCSCLMSAIERQHVVTCDITGAFLQTNWPDELDDCYIHFETLMVKMICDINPEYKEHVVYTNNSHQRHLYAKVKKSVYGTLMGAILFYNKLSNQLEEWVLKRIHTMNVPSIKLWTVNN